MIGGIFTLIMALSGGITATGVGALSLWGSLLLLWKAKWAIGVVMFLTIFDFLLAKYFIGQAFLALVMPSIPSEIACIFVTLDVQPCLAALASAYTFRVIKFIIITAISAIK